MSLLVYSTEECFIELFCEVRSAQGQTNKIPKGRRKHQVGSHLDLMQYVTEVRVRS